MNAHQAVIADLESKLSAAQAQLDNAIEHDGDAAKARRAVDTLEKEIKKVQTAQAEAAGRAAADQEAARKSAAAALEDAASDDSVSISLDAARAVTEKLSAFPGLGHVKVESAYFQHAARGVAVARRTDAALRTEAKTIADRVSGLERKLSDRMQQSAAIVDARITGGVVDPKDTATLFANEKDAERLRELIANARGELNQANARVAEQAAVLKARVADQENMINGVVTRTLNDRLKRAEQDLLSAARAVYADSVANGNRLPGFLSHYTWCTEIERLFRLGKI